MFEESRKEVNILDAIKEINQKLDQNFAIQQQKFDRKIDKLDEKFDQFKNSTNFFIQDLTMKVASLQSIYAIGAVSIGSLATFILMKIDLGKLLSAFK